MLNPVYRRALDEIANSVNDGISHRNDLEKVAILFDRILRFGVVVSGPDDIRQYLIQNHQMSEAGANDIQLAYEVLFASHHGGQNWWSENFIDELRQEAEKLG